MNIASIPLAAIAHLPTPVKVGFAAAHAEATLHLAFKGQLEDAIEDPKGGTKDPKQRGAGEGDKPDTAKKKEDRPPQPIAVVAPQPMPPPPPPPPAASFGLPSAGVEAGSAPEIATNTTDPAEQSPIDKLTPDTSTNVAVDRSTPPAEAAQPDRKTELVFALKLADLTPDRDAKPVEATAKPVMAKTLQADPQAQPDVVSRPDVRIKVAFTPLADPKSNPAEITRPELRTEPVFTTVVVSSPAPELPVAPEQTPAATPIKAAQPAQQSAAVAAPVPVAPHSREAATEESGSHTSDGHASEKETPKFAQPQPAVEPKSFRQAGATSQTMSNASKETPLQTPGPTLTTAASTPVAAPVPEPSSTVMTAAIPAEQVFTSAAPVRSNPASPVTEVSVTVPVPRADSGVDDRVAIRMMQRGSEIHVSVRTPDTQLAESLRHDLGKLSAGLDQGGFRTETWRPTPAGGAAQSNTNSQHESSQGSPNRDTAGSDARPGNGGQGAGEQKRKQQDERPRWVAELEQQRNR